MQKIVLLGLAGALGSLARYGLAGLVQRATPGSFPLGTFIVNVLGCLAFGFSGGSAKTASPCTRTCAWCC